MSRPALRSEYCHVPASAIRRVIRVESWKRGRKTFGRRIRALVEFVHPTTGKTTRRQFNVSPGYQSTVSDFGYPSSAMSVQGGCVLPEGFFQNLPTDESGSWSGDQVARFVAPQTQAAA